MDLAGLSPQSLRSRDSLLKVKEASKHSQSNNLLTAPVLKEIKGATGLMMSAFKYVKAHGIQTESQYPYTARNGRCQDTQQTPTFTLKGFSDVPQGDSDQLAAAVSQRVVSIAIEADTEVFQFYSEGVIDSADCGTDLDHGVAAVGYGSENGKDFWIVRNSWGSNWGDKGYVKILKQQGRGAGVCGITQLASYPIA